MDVGLVMLLTAGLSFRRLRVDSTLRRWRLLGSLLFEKPFEEGRDAVDLITSVGVGWKLQPALAPGVKAVGEDLEGLWEKEEAEGGASLFFGPVMCLAIPSRHRRSLSAPPAAFTRRGTEPPWSSMSNPASHGDGPGRPAWIWSSPC
jgi:hypothetical protein